MQGPKNIKRQSQPVNTATTWQEILPAAIPQDYRAAFLLKRQDFLTHPSHLKVIFSMNLLIIKTLTQLSVLGSSIGELRTAFH